MPVHREQTRLQRHEESGTSNRNRDHFLQVDLSLLIAPTWITSGLPTNRPDSCFWTRRHISGHATYQD